MLEITIRKLEDGTFEGSFHDDGFKYSQTENSVGRLQHTAINTYAYVLSKCRSRSEFFSLPESAKNDLISRAAKEVKFLVI